MTLNALRKAMQQAGVDALWVSQPTNVRFVSGFTDGAAGKVLITPGTEQLYTDGRFIVQAREESRMPQFIARPPETLRHAAGNVKGLRVGFEAQHLTVAELEDLRREWPEATLVPVRGVVEELRSVKTAQEIQAIRAAQDLADRVYGEVRPMIKAGAREQDLALEIEMRLRRAGARPSFPTIVVSGPRGAMPHGMPSDKLLQEGELITIDMGAELNGYASDMTRTVAVGTPSDEMRRVYNAVLEAEEAAVKAVKPGVRAGDLDKLARDILTGNGLGEAFAHSLGHGVGMNVHEAPALRSGSEDILKEGMIITIEPGAYLPDVGGVRIEDLVLVTANGYEVLSHSPKETL